MAVFPVIDSILSTAHLANWVAERYGFSRVHCRTLKTNINHTYLVSSGEGQAVLRVYSRRFRPKAHVTEELGLLRKLHADGIPVSYPLHDLQGECLQEILAPEGLRYAVLFSFAEGSKVRHLPEAMSRSIGQLAGRIHESGLGHNLTRNAYAPSVMVAWTRSQLERLYPDFEELPFLDACAQRLDGVFDLPDLRRGIVHLDIWYDNLSVRDDGAITLFDFDNCGTGPLVLDIGYYCLQLYFTESDKVAYEQKRSAFLFGYRSVLPLTDVELDLAPYAGLAIWLYYAGLQAERFDHSGNLFLSENYLRMYLGRIREWLQYHELEIASGI